MWVRVVVILMVLVIKVSVKRIRKDVQDGDRAIHQAVIHPVYRIAQMEHVRVGEAVGNLVVRRLAAHQIVPGKAVVGTVVGVAVEVVLAVQFVWEVIVVLQIHGQIRCAEIPQTVVVMNKWDRQDLMIVAWEHMPVAEMLQVVPGRERFRDIKY